MRLAYNRSLEEKDRKEFERESRAFGSGVDVNVGV